jgi:hypothetical protein
MWNEPNLGQFLSAGVCGATPKDTSSLYRSLYTAGYTAARAASGQQAIVYLGELSEITRSVKPASCAANSKRAQSTITFLGDVVNTTPLLAHGVAWHAYQHRSQPRTDSRGTGIYDIARFQTALTDMYHSGVLRTPTNKKVGLYITEFGYWNVPLGSHEATAGSSAVSWREDQRATYLTSALNRAAQNSARMIIFWQLNEAYSDLAAVTAALTDGLAFDTGMLGKSSQLPMNGPRPYGEEGPTPSWGNPQKRKAFCRVRQWSIDNAKAPLALPTGC